MRNIIKIGNSFIDFDKIFFVSKTIKEEAYYEYQDGKQEEKKNTILTIHIHMDGLREPVYENNISSTVSRIKITNELASEFMEKWNKYLEQNNNKLFPIE